MKIFLRILIITIILIVLGYLGFGIYSKTIKKNETATRIVSLPAFRFNTLDGKEITNKHISGKALWLIFFDTDCEYCQMEAENIHRSGKIKDMEIWLVSSENPDTLAVFAKKYALNHLSYVQLLNDKYHADHYSFDVTSSPASFLYGSNGLLIKQYKGVVKTEKILQDLKEAGL